MQKQVQENKEKLLEGGGEKKEKKIKKEVELEESEEMEEKPET